MDRISGSKTIIAVDALAVSRESAGSFTVLLGLMRELMELCDYDFVIYTLCGDVEDKLGGYGGRIKYIYAPGWAKAFVLRCLWQQLVLPRLAKKAECRILYSASGYPEIFAHLPVVTHQQNLWSFIEPQSWWPLKILVKSFFRRHVAKIALIGSDANIFISDSLRDSANQMVPKTAEKNFTVHNATSSTELLSEIPLTEDWADGDFCLAIGSLVIHKNYLTLIRAFRLVADECPALHLVIVGNCANEYGEKVKQLCRELRVADRIIFTGALEFEKVMSLYQKANFSVNISLLEGFGLPVLESLSFGCPIVCSDAPVFQEIGGEAVVYCDPTSSTDVAEKMTVLYRDEDKRKQLISVGRERTKCFSWRSSANKLLDVFRFVLEG